jgi:hypothetical protein
MVYISDKQSVAITSIPYSVGEKSLETSFKAALEHARRLTQMYGFGATEVAVAWDAVEELLTARVRQPKSSSAAFEQYCTLHPDAPECRIYDV